MKVAIITRTKDRPLLLARAINSVLSQTHQEWVHVIVNDGGDVNAVEKVVDRYSHNPFYFRRVKIIHLACSLGMEHASNQGILACDSEAIAIHDDDDTWNPRFLECLSEKLARLNDRYAGVVCRTQQVFESLDGSGTVNIVRKRYLDPHLNFISQPRMQVVNQFMPIAFLFKRSIYNAIGGFDLSFEVCGDWDFNLRLLSKFKIKVVPGKLAYYHVRVNQNGAYQNSVTRHRLHQHYIGIIRLKYPIRPGFDSIAAWFYERLYKRIFCFGFRFWEILTHQEGI